MKVKNWDDWQPVRKGRGTPPWIKLYRNLLSNEEWISLSDSEKGQLVSIWILAADKSGNIPDNPLAVQKMCMLDNKPNLNKFIDLGFLVATVSPNCRQVVAQEKIREDKSRVDKSKDKASNKSDIALEAFEYWLLVMNKSSSSTKLTDKRKKTINARLKDGYTINQIKQAIDGCKNDPFSMGDNDRRKPFNDIELICRTGEKLESFMQQLATKGRQFSAFPETTHSQTTEQNIKNIGVWLDGH